MTIFSISVVHYFIYAAMLLFSMLTHTSKKIQKSEEKGKKEFENWWEAGEFENSPFCTFM